MKNEKQATDPITPRYAMSGFHIKAGGFMGVAAIDPMPPHRLAWG